MFKLAFRNVFRQKGRTALTLAAIVLGVMSLILSGGFIEDIFHQLSEATIHSQIGHIQVYREGYSGAGRSEPYRYMIDDPADLIAGLQAFEGVAEVNQRLFFSGLLNNGRSDLSIIGEGIEPDKEARLGTFIKMVEGRPLQDGDAYGILLGQGVAQGLDVHVGDYVSLLANTPEGALNSLQLQVIGVFRSISKEFDARAVRLKLSDAQELLNVRSVHSLVLRLNDTQLTTPVAQVLAQGIMPRGYEFKTWRQLAEFYRKTVDLYERQFLVLQLIILGLVLLGVVNSVNITIYDRTGEFGTLMALGNRREDVFQMVILENVILGLLGALIGVLLGMVAAWLISRIGIPMPPPPNMNAGYTAQIQLVPEVVVTGCVIAFLATVCAAVVPARRVANLPVVEALRQN